MISCGPLVHRVEIKLRRRFIRKKDIEEEKRVSTKG